MSCGHRNTPQTGGGNLFSVLEAGSLGSVCLGVELHPSEIQMLEFSPPALQDVAVGRGSACKEAAELK